jgi:hypothetical protein
MNLMIDGAAFQLRLVETTRLWLSLLSQLAEDPAITIVLLDRGGSPALPGMKILTFPSYRVDNGPADSFLLEEFCKEQATDVFLSTYYTTPVETPSLLLLNNELGEDCWPNFSDRAEQEREIAISHASFFLRQAGSPIAEQLQRQLARLGVVDQNVTSFTTTEDAAKALHKLAALARDERESDEGRQFFREWERLRAIQGETDIGEKLEFPKIRGNVPLATFLCSIAQHLSRFSESAPVLAKLASAIDREGVAMWNANLPPVRPSDY